MQEQEQVRHRREEWLILSDTHGRMDRVRRVLSLCAPVDGILFLGDGERDMKTLEKEHPDLPILCVRGNCDFFSDFPLARICTVAGHRILLTHGHLCGARPDDLAKAGYDAGAEAVLFGHTHRHQEWTESSDDGRRLFCFNPGSIARPEGGLPHFGRLTADEKDLLFSVGTLD